MPPRFSSVALTLLALGLLGNSNEGGCDFYIAPSPRQLCQDTGGQWASGSCACPEEKPWANGRGCALRPRKIIVGSAVTWRVLGLIYRETVHEEQTITMNAAELALAEEGFNAFPETIYDLSGGALGIELTLVYPDHPLTNLQPLAGYGEGAIWPARESIADEVRAHPGFDGVVTVWKHGPDIQPGYGVALDAGRHQAGHAEFPVEFMQLESNRPYEGLVHEFGHSLEGFYCQRNFFDSCGDLGQEQCSGDALYPDASWCCCYRAIYSGEVSAPDGSSCRLGAATYAAKGTPTSPK